MIKPIRFVASFSLITGLLALPTISSADVLGVAIKDANSALFESLAVQVKASQLMKEAEVIQIPAFDSRTAADLLVTQYDAKADEYKDRSKAALDKAADYLNLGNGSTNSESKSNYSKAADNYEQTSYFYAVAADLYLKAQQKVLGMANSIKASPLASKNAENLQVLSSQDSKAALNEAKVELAVQTKNEETAKDATNASTALGTAKGITEVKQTLTSLKTNIDEKKAQLATMAKGYAEKAKASTGDLKAAYEEAAKTYEKAAIAAESAATKSAVAVTKFANAIPESPKNPGENLKWHIFQSDPQTALAVMKYNFAQLANGAIRWQGEVQNVMQNPAPYLDQSIRTQPILEYIDGFRTSSLSVSAEAENLVKLLGQYNDLIPKATKDDAEIWTQVSSYLADIIVTNRETAQAQYQIYSFLSLESGLAIKTADLVKKSDEVVSVLAAGEKKVPLGGEIQSELVNNKTQIDVYTSQPGKSVTIQLTKSGAKPISRSVKTDNFGVAELNLTKSFVGYSAKALMGSKTLDTEKIAK